MDRPKNFYVQGSMGAALGVAMGIALNKPNEEIVAIIGDGEALMNMDNLILLKKLQKEEKIKNITLFILDNNKYQSTGGQKTVSDSIDFRYICDCFTVFCGESKVTVPRIDIPHEQICKRFMNAIK
jgi:thiamine pyrophosphate-dependent acetolactate synthase large subunit-like protein